MKTNYSDGAATHESVNIRHKIVVNIAKTGNVFRVCNMKRPICLIQRKQN